MQQIKQPVSFSEIKASTEGSKGRVLVTGGAGYIGSHTVLALYEAGWDVTVVDDLSTGSEKLVPKGVALHVANIGDRIFMSNLLARIQPKAIIHFAGSLSVPESVANPLKYYTNNVVNTCNLLSVAVDEGIDKFIFSSTAAVYGIPNGERVPEHAPTRPINPYGRSKLMIEDILSDVAMAHPLRYVALRYFNVAGADLKGRAGQVAKNSTNLIKVVSELAAGRRNQLTVHGSDYETSDGTCVRDFIHVTDLAAAHVAALNYLVDDGESAVLNCGYGTGYSVLSVLRAASKVAGQNLAYTYGPRRAGDPAQVVADPRRIHERLAWVPKHNNLELMLRSAIAWEQSLDPAPAAPVAAPRQQPAAAQSGPGQSVTSKVQSAPLPAGAALAYG
jgi:UDP-glucose 4-epimerase